MAAACTLAWDAPLRDRNTLRVDARAHCLATVHDAGALPALLDEPALRGLPLLVLGEGSNVLFATPRFEGLVVHLACDAIRVLAEEATHTTVLVEAAQSWDALVDWTLDHGLQGLENLALIPGQAGAAPIQNIGAYGVEVGEFVAAVHAYDRVARKAERLAARDCGFGYRTSRFKQDPGRYVVVDVTFQLPLGDLGAPVRYAELARVLGVEQGQRARVAARDVPIALSHIATSANGSSRSSSGGLCAGVSRDAPSPPAGDSCSWSRS